MSDSTNIIQFESVTVDDSHGYDVGLRDVSFSLGNGELAVVLLERPYFNVPLVDVANGVLCADSGVATFCGRDWKHTLASRAERQRGQIGRIFDGPSWLSNLDVDENILLPQRHHFSLSDAQLMIDAATLARSFGLKELPSGRPSQSSPADLHRCAGVRAFLGNPVLLLLERPEHGNYPALMAPLLENLRAARQRGAAAIWVTNLVEVFDSPDLNPTARYRMQGAELKVVQIPAPPTPRSKGNQTGTADGPHL